MGPKILFSELPSCSGVSFFPFYIKRFTIDIHSVTQSIMGCIFYSEYYGLYILLRVLWAVYSTQSIMGCIFYSEYYGLYILLRVLWAVYSTQSIMGCIFYSEYYGLYILLRVLWAV